MFKHVRESAAVALLSLIDGFRREHHYGRTRYPAGWRRIGRGRYDPHQGEREIARRLRQAERDDQRQRNRAADDFGCQVEQVERLSRRGRYLA